MTDANDEMIMFAKYHIGACAAATFSLLAHTALAEELPTFVQDIDAGKIAVISDGDFVGTTYATGQLAPADAGYSDMLTILSLADGMVVSQRLSVSNSVTAPPEVLAVTPNGDTAFVIERLGKRPAGAKFIGDLPPGNSLFAIDLTGESWPRIAATADLPTVPDSVAVSPDGNYVAITANTPETSIVEIRPYSSGEFGDSVRFDLATVNPHPDEDAPRGGITATAVNWHPSGRYLAVNLTTQNRIVFLEVGETDGELTMTPWGNSVTTGTDPFVGRFTPDGRHYLTSDWGRDFSATTLEGRLPQRPSSISVIRLGDPGTGTLHRRVGGVDTDISAEGIAVSPDGTLIATVNMRGTPFLPNTARHTRHASVTLLSFDTESGDISKIADYPVDGILPEGGSFDLSGSHFMATVFEGYDGRSAGLEVFKVVGGANPALDHVGRIPMPHGAHHIAVSR